MRFWMLAGLVVLVLPPVACRAEPAALEAVTQDALAVEVRRDLGAGYTIEPLDDLFVVAANTDRESLDQCKETVRHSYRALYSMYFDKKPERPLSIYLFRDKSSYEDYCVRHYHEKPNTPYGFFWPAERKLVMNIATGRGTLVHEMVHPFISADFPDVPTWFNEGLASLYEQSTTERDGTGIRGMVNWRLPRLQDAVAGDRLIPLSKLTAMSTAEFYEDRGLPYAEARYLCMYLQEQGNLVDFYKKFRAAAKAEDAAKRDTTGGPTLEAVTGQSLAELQKHWVAWVKTLRWDR